MGGGGGGGVEGGVGWCCLVTSWLAIVTRHLRSPQRVPPQNIHHRHNCCDVPLTEVSHTCVVICSVEMRYSNQSGCCKNCVACLNNTLLLDTYPVRRRKSRQPLASERGQSQLVWPWPCGLRLNKTGGCSEKGRRVWSRVQRGPGQRLRQLLLGLLLLHVTAGHPLW